MTADPGRPDRPVSVVIPTRDRAHLLEECLVSLRKSLRPFDELIVADSASMSPDVKTVALAFDAKYIRCRLPGTSRARNAGWRAARHEIVAFVDDDVRVDPTWASALAKVFDDPGVAFVTGAIGWPDVKRAAGPAVAVMERPDALRLDASTTGIIGHSANLSARRSALEHVGGFDELLGPGVRFRAAEDHDLFDRLFASGYVGRYEPSVSSYHESWRRIREWVRLQGAYGWGTGARIAKLLRTDRPHSIRAARIAIIDWSLRPMVKSIRPWDRTVIAGSLVRLASTIAGFAIAIFTPVRDGHFRGRSNAT
jgi:glycosyltransferase involved in cell wall biosynthesis